MKAIFDFDSPVGADFRREGLPIFCTRGASLRLDLLVVEVTAVPHEGDTPDWSSGPKPDLFRGPVQRVDLRPAARIKAALPERF